MIANGALTMGGQATLFFTFWGLNALRKLDAPPIKDKTAMDKMFGKMLPKGLPALPLSNMNFGGAGKKMMVDCMPSKDLKNLEGLLVDALKGGARLVACSMSMEAMGIRKEELIDGVEIGGVAEFLPTQAVTKAETGSWKWAGFQLLYMSALAYVSALVVCQGLNWLGIS